MTLLKFKDGVIVSQQLIIAAAVTNAASALALNLDMTVTSGRDGVHMATSKHYVDQALDFRTKHLKGHDVADLMAAVKRTLGRDYDVILESPDTANQHLHVEFDRKSPLKGTV